MKSKVEILSSNCFERNPLKQTSYEEPGNLSRKILKWTFGCRRGLSIIRWRALPESKGGAIWQADRQFLTLGSEENDSRLYWCQSSRTFLSSHLCYLAINPGRIRGGLMNGRRKIKILMGFPLSIMVDQETEIILPLKTTRKFGRNIFEWFSYLHEKANKTLNIYRANIWEKKKTDR